MERRSFLKGVLASIGAGTALVRLANPEETRALMAAQPVVLAQPSRVELPNYSDMSSEVYLRRKDGRFQPIGIIRSIEFRQELIDVTSWSGEAMIIPGMRNGKLYFEGEL